MGALYSKVVWGAEDSPDLVVPITLTDDATVPDYATTGAAGMDLHAAERVELEPGKPALVETGVSMALPFMLYGQIQGRSGLAYKESLYVHPGVVDCDFRGSIKVLATHTKPSKYNYVIEKGDRIAQLLVLPVARPGLKIVTELPVTTRGEGGFGSTGTRATAPEEGAAISIGVVKDDGDKENVPVAKPLTEEHV